MRGKPGKRRFNGGGSGLIPAHAGKTPLPSKPKTNPGAHPRACGENIAPAPSNPSAKGSSPRMRGKRRASPRWSQPRGLIPAHAGKTSRKSLETSRRRAHPRACGENAEEAVGEDEYAGSSPRMRGKLRDGRKQGRGEWLIPAHAGKTESTRRVICKSWAHPRACGENGGFALGDKGGSGSSPRMRGKRVSTARPRNANGLIPAHAGKTL